VGLAGYFHFNHHYYYQKSKTMLVTYRLYVHGYINIYMSLEQE